MPWVGTWEGGRIWQSPKTSRRTYVIRREVNGKEYAISTRTTTLRAALEHLKRFEMDPDGYRPDGVKGKAKLVLDDDLISGWADYCESDLQNDREWLAKKRNYLLTFWKPVLKGRDIRKVGLTDLTDALEGEPSQRNKVEAIKSLTSWLRKKGKLKTWEDPTAELTVTAAAPAQWTKSRVIPAESHSKVVAVIGKPWDDLLTILAATGWHLTELHRFCKGGEVVDREEDAVLACPRHKSGDTHRTAVARDVAEAGRRMLAYGGFSKVNLGKALKKACKAVGIPPYTAGCYRHTVASAAVEAGASMEAVAAFLGHRSMATTKRYYATLAVPPKIPTPLTDEKEVA